MVKVQAFQFSDVRSARRPEQESVRRASASVEVVEDEEESEEDAKKRLKKLLRSSAKTDVGDRRQAYSIAKQVIRRRDEEDEDEFDPARGADRGRHVLKAMCTAIRGQVRGKKLAANWLDLIKNRLSEEDEDEVDDELQEDEDEDRESKPLVVLVSICEDLKNMGETALLHEVEECIEELKDTEAALEDLRTSFAKQQEKLGDVRVDIDKCLGLARSRLRRFEGHVDKIQEQLGHTIVRKKTGFRRSILMAPSFKKDIAKLSSAQQSAGSTGSDELAAVSPEKAVYALKDALGTSMHYLEDELLRNYREEIEPMTDALGMEVPEFLQEGRSSLTASEHGSDAHTASSRGHTASSLQSRERTSSAKRSRRVCFEDESNEVGVVSSPKAEDLNATGSRSEEAANTPKHSMPSPVHGSEGETHLGTTAQSGSTQGGTNIGTTIESGTTQDGANMCTTTESGPAQAGVNMGTKTESGSTQAGTNSDTTAQPGLIQGNEHGRYDFVFDTGTATQSGPSPSVEPSGSHSQLLSVHAGSDSEAGQGLRLEEAGAGQGLCADEAGADGSRASGAVDFHPGSASADATGGSGSAEAVVSTAGGTLSESADARDRARDTSTEAVGAAGRRGSSSAEGVVSTAGGTSAESVDAVAFAEAMRGVGSAVASALQRSAASSAAGPGLHDLQRRGGFNASHESAEEEEWVPSDRELAAEAIQRRIGTEVQRRVRSSMLPSELGAAMQEKLVAEEQEGVVGSPSSKASASSKDFASRSSHLGMQSAGEVLPGVLVSNDFHDGDSSPDHARMLENDPATVSKVEEIGHVRASSRSRASAQRAKFSQLGKSTSLPHLEVASRGTSAAATTQEAERLAAHLGDAAGQLPKLEEQEEEEDPKFGNLALETPSTALPSSPGFLRTLSGMESKLGSYGLGESCSESSLIKPSHAYTASNFLNIGDDHSSMKNKLAKPQSELSTFDFFPGMLPKVATQTVPPTPGGWPLVRSPPAEKTRTRLMKTERGADVFLPPLPQTPPRTAMVEKMSSNTVEAVRLDRRRLTALKSHPSRAAQPQFTFPKKPWETKARKAAPPFGGSRLVRSGRNSHTPVERRKALNMQQCTSLPELLQSQGFHHLQGWGKSLRGVERSPVAKH